MSMKQAGKENKVNVQEAGTVASGGGLDETPAKNETPLFAVGILAEDSLVRAETVVITNT